MISKYLPSNYKSNIRKLRENEKLSVKEMLKLLEENGFSTGERAYRSYERDEVMPPISLAWFLSEHYKVSIDYVLGKDKCTSVDNQYISDQLGLNDSAIKALKRYNKIDSDNEDDLEAFKKQLEKDPGATHNMFMWYMPIINFMLSNKHLKAFLERFIVMNRDLYQVPVYKDKKGFKTFPSYLSDSEDYLYFSVDPNRPDDNVGVRIDSDFRYEINKNLISRSIDSMAADYKKILEKNTTIIETDSK